MINKKTLARIKKALAAAVGALVGELALIALVGGTYDQKSVGAAVGFAVAVGWATYKAKNKLGVNELRDQLEDAMAQRRT